MRALVRQLLPALLMLAVFTVITGIAYPLAVTAVAQVTMKDNAEGSLLEKDGEVVGSEQIGQQFTKPEYFHPRPSAAGQAGYDGTLSLGANLGPIDESLLASIDERAVAYRELNGLAEDAEVPVDAVTASASGLDPHISVANARLQAARVADERGVDVDDVLDLIDDNTDGRDLWVLGEPGVNVLELNLALDEASPRGE